MLGLFLTFFVACEAQKSETVIQTEVETVKYEGMLDKFQQQDNRLYVVNFWATWCKPCIEELPEFMEVNEAFANDPDFKMYLVSMDNAAHLDERVIPFIADNKLSAEVFLLDDNKRMNTWIPLVDESWSGAIPATAFYKNGEQVFFIEGTMTKEQLTEKIQNFK